MFQSCFSCNHLSRASESNHGKTAGMGRLNELRQAVNHVSEVSQSCASLAAQFEGDIKKLPDGDLRLAKSLYATSKSLSDFVLSCKSMDIELKCFSKYFTQSYPKCGSKSSTVDLQKDYFDKEVNRRSQSTAALAKKGLPVMQNAEYILKKGARAVSLDLRLRLVQAVEDLDRMAASQG